MQSFVKVNLGDIVFDKESRESGKVNYIDFKKNTAKVEVIVSSNKKAGTRTTKLIDARLSNLLVIEKSKKKPNLANKYWNLVRIFHKAFNHPVADIPAPLTLDRMTKRSVWTVEEVIEMIHGASSNKEEFLGAITELIEGIEKAVDKSLKEEFPQTDFDRIVAQLDGSNDAIYFLTGTQVELGIEPDKPFEIIQEANMSKLFTDENGNKYVKTREDGKILKSPEFVAPEPRLREEVSRQIKLKSRTV